MVPENNNTDSDGQSELPEGATLAALDLGSNSFHLIIARFEHDELRVVETLAEKVQLGAGLKNGQLDRASIDRGLECLARFKQVLDSVGPYRTRAVGTNALRKARNRRAFTGPAQQILGTPVDVIYGHEEARLVYLGVAHTLADDEQSRLVVDIGGGSTEFIVGERFETRALDSLQLGCVSHTSRYFGNGKISKRRYRSAYTAARLEISRVRRVYQAGNWQEAVGSSGTLQAIESLLLLHGWSELGITRQGLNNLEQKLLSFRHLDDIAVDGLNENRRNVILAGTAITSAMFDELSITLMRTSPGALREGVLYDLIGRLSHEDVRERSIQALMQRYGVDQATVELVEKRARVLYLATRKDWQLDRSDWKFLRWASHTHEIGMAISHKKYNQHGAYVLRASDLPGFSQDEQETLALLVLCHRRGIAAANFSGWDRSAKLRMLRLVCLLRLATLFKYVEQLEYLPEFRVSADETGLQLEFPNDWLAQHPQTTQSLKQEKTVLAKAGLKLQFSG